MHEAPDAIVWHPFQRPIAAGDEPPDVPVVGDRLSNCTCTTSPWCTGPAGPGWLDCSRTCRACHPTKPKRRRRALGANDPGPLNTPGLGGPGFSLLQEQDRGEQD